MTKDGSVETEHRDGVPGHAVQVVGVEGIPGQGPHMVIVLRVADGVIAEAKYSTYGCPVVAVCGQFVCEHVEGKTAEEAADLDERAVTVGLGPMPLGREHCPALAVKALRHALAQLAGGGPADADAPG